MDDWLSVVMEEYKTLRNESLTSMQNQQSVLNFGTASMALVTAAGFNLWNNSPLSEIIFLFFVPVICYLILAIWIGEVSRMMRAGKFLSEIEKKVNKKFKNKPDALTWETSLHDSKYKGKIPRIIGSNISIIILFLFFSLSSILIGNFKISKKALILDITCINILEAVFFIGICIFLIIRGRGFKKRF